MTSACCAMTAWPSCSVQSSSPSIIRRIRGKGTSDLTLGPTPLPRSRWQVGRPAGSHEWNLAANDAKLADGVVTTPRAEADLMVTEHGIAELRGRTLAERVRALVAVADPAFRTELEEASERLV